MFALLSEPLSQAYTVCISFPDTEECLVPVHILSYPPLAGLTGSVTIDNIPLNGFIIYSLEMTMSFFERYVPTYAQKTLGGIRGLTDVKLFTLQMTSQDSEK